MHIKLLAQAGNSSLPICYGIFAVLEINYFNNVKFLINLFYQCDAAMLSLNVVTQWSVPPLLAWDNQMFM